MKKWLRQIYYSFSFQLLMLHVRSNHLLTITWVVLGLFVTGQLGMKLGIPFLFLAPEYLGLVNFWSFFFLGLAFGGFYMSWNLTIYLLSSHYFPFLASLSKPFTKFSVNNGILPLAFSLIYLGMIIHFQIYYEKVTTVQAIGNIIGFLAGTIALILLYTIYFQFTNRDISYYRRQTDRPPNLIRNIAPGRRGVDLDYIKQDKHSLGVKTYINEALQVRLVRSVAHYDSSMLMSIFKQNHLNALITQLLSMMTLLFLGYLIDQPLFRIPAAASVFILANIVTAIIGALTYWFNEWRTTLIILMLVGVNFFTSFEFFNRKNKAYGLNYTTAPAEYSVDRLLEVCDTALINADKKATETILQNWHNRVATDSVQKPKMVLLSVSGGGLKSAVWTMHAIRSADQALAGQLLEHTVLITGASGGMLGLSYLRELYLRQHNGEDIDIYDPIYIDNISKDLLNPITFTLVSNDLFLPWSSFEKNGQRYHKDRGYILEKQLSENLDFILDKRLEEYREPEQQALIPMLFITPSIVNDARRLIISPQAVRYMMVAPVGITRQNSVEIDAVDFAWAFEEQDAQNLSFLSALRMNATYPYILPNVHLPSNPEIAVVDAGFLDNYGILTATRFLQVFRSWILENTSGVVLVQISSSEKIEEINTLGNKGIIESLFDPLGIAGKVIERQEFEQDNSLGFTFDLLGRDHFEVIRFIYHPSEENALEASISFHITEREKRDVMNAFNLEDNQSSLRQLQKALTQ
jgi:hypothetical protein